MSKYFNQKQKETILESLAITRQNLLDRIAALDVQIEEVQNKPLVLRDEEITKANGN